MTRINMVDPADLSDQHLKAELRELPRVFSFKIDISDAPERYCLGKGHVRWAKSYPYFIRFRYKDLYKEAMFRGFETSYKPTWMSMTDTKFEVFTCFLLGGEK